MHTQTKWLIAILICLLLFFVCSLVQFYRENARTEASVVQGSESSLHSGYEIFQESSSGLYGLRSNAGETVISPEWTQLQFLGEATIMAERKIGAVQAKGILDMDGNVIVPFVYRDFSYVAADVIAGTVLEEDTYFFYDTDLHPLTPCAWNAYTLNGTTLTLQRGSNLFSYRLRTGGLHLYALELRRNVMRRNVQIHCSNALAIRMLSVEEWMELGDVTADMLRAYQKRSVAAMADTVTEEAQKQFEKQQRSGIMEQWELAWTEKVSAYQNATASTTVEVRIPLVQETEDGKQKHAFWKISVKREIQTGKLQVTNAELLEYSKGHL